MNMSLLLVIVGMARLWPAFVLPIIIGILILRPFRDDPIRGLVRAFTMKPLIATPLWLFILGFADRSPDLTLAFSLLPGIGLTLYFVYQFRHLFGTEKNIFYILLAGDALRWLNSFAFMLVTGGGPLQGFSEEPFFLAGMILPNAYAVMVLVILWLRRRGGQGSSVMHAP